MHIQLGEWCGCAFCPALGVWCGCAFCPAPLPRPWWMTRPYSVGVSRLQCLGVYFAPPSTLLCGCVFGLAPHTLCAAMGVLVGVPFNRVAGSRRWCGFATCGCVPPVVCAACTLMSMLLS